MELWMGLAVGGVAFAFLGAYVLVMVLWPEWVGITGKVALEAERSHLGESPATDDFINRLHERTHEKASTRNSTRV